MFLVVCHMDVSSVFPYLSVGDTTRGIRNFLDRVVYLTPFLRPRRQASLIEEHTLLGI